MIKEFQGEYRWLSNFWEFETPMKYQGLTFITNEHFYVAMKTKDLSIRKQVSEHPLNGLKKFGNSFPLREDWNDIKVEVMLHGLKYKFSEYNPTLRQKLLDTGKKIIQEGNYWNDKFWGVCLKTDEGKNTLGCLLMEVRGELANESLN